MTCNNGYIYHFDVEDGIFMFLYLKNVIYIINARTGRLEAIIIQQKLRPCLDTLTELEVRVSF